jgi:hypothetical protein
MTGPVPLRSAARLRGEASWRLGRIFSRGKGCRLVPRCIFFMQSQPVANNGVMKAAGETADVASRSAASPCKPSSSVDFDRNVKDARYLTILGNDTHSGSASVIR